MQGLQKKYKSVPYGFEWGIALFILAKNLFH